MTPVDDVLRALYNPMRREILRAIVEGRAYPLGISRDIGGTQQAVLKHLCVLEKVGVVRRVGRERTSSGPPRVIYGISTRITLTIDLTENIMNVRAEEIEADEDLVMEYRHLAESGGMEALEEAIEELRRELARLEERRASLIKSLDAAMRVKRELAH